MSLTGDSATGKSIAAGRRPATSSASTWSWVARRRSSCTTTRTSTRQLAVPSRAASSTPARTARPRRASTSSARSTSEFLGCSRATPDSVRVGDPEDPSTDMGTLINDAQVLRVEGFVERAKAAGARVISGGARAVVPGLAGRRLLPGDRARGRRPGCRDASSRRSSARCSRCCRSRRRTRSSTKANDTRYGLASSVWTQGCVQGDARRQDAQLRRGVGQRPPAHRERDAPRRLQAVGLRQGHVRSTRSRSTPRSST